MTSKGIEIWVGTMPDTGNTSWRVIMPDVPRSAIIVERSGRDAQDGHRWEDVPFGSEIYGRAITAAVRYLTEIIYGYQEANEAKEAADP